MARLDLARVRLALLLACALVTAHARAADDFGSRPLAGIGRLQVAVDGVAADFARYGLTAAELQQRVTARLASRGVPVVDGDAARTAADAARLLVRLITNRDQYSMYFYAVSVRIERKVPLDTSGASFTAHEVWSEGQHGILNPSDLKRIYGYVDTLVDSFLAAYGRDNAGVTRGGD